MTNQLTWLTWPVRVFRFAVWFAWQLILSNVAVVRDNITPGQNSTPGIARYTTACRTDGEITMLAALITLTPGTLTLGTDIHYIDDAPHRVLFVHSMYAPNADELRAELAVMETKMLNAMRRKGVTA